jgi:hypothetical protein
MSSLLVCKDVAGGFTPLKGRLLKVFSMPVPHSSRSPDDVFQQPEYANKRV